MRRRVFLVLVPALAVSIGAALSGRDSQRLVPGPLTGGRASSVVAAAPARAAALHSTGRASTRMRRAVGPRRSGVFARASHPQRAASPESEVAKHTTLLPKAIAPRVVASSAGAEGTPVISTRLEGLNSDQGQADPPDVQAAAGPTAIVEMVNAVYVMWSRTGTVLDSGPLDEFFSDSGVDRRGDEVTDPRVLYDARSGRWFTALFDVTRGESIVGVSDTSDPTGTWGVVAYPFQDRSAGTCPDQPRLGLSDGFVVLGVDLFADCNGGALRGGVVLVFDKQQMIGPPGPIDVGFYQGGTSLTQITPAVSLGPTATEFLVSIERENPTVADLYTVSAVHGRIPIRPIPITRMDPPPDAPQNGTSDPVATGDDRVQNARWLNGKLLFVASDACRSGKVVAACARLAQVDTASSRLDWEKELTLGDGRHLFYPAAELDDAGNVMLTFGYSSGTEFPGIGAVTLQANGQFSSWTVVQKGTAPKLPLRSGPRYGDYFGIARDPAVPSRVWGAAEYANGLDQRLGWGTKVFSMAAGTANPPPPPPPDTKKPSARPQATKVRRRHVARLRFAVRDNSGRAVVTMGVFRGSRRVKGFRPLELDNGRWFLNWRAPSRPSRLRFCVSAVDSAGNASKRACAPIRVT